MLDMKQLCLLLTGINSRKPDNEIVLADNIRIILNQQRLESSKLFQI